MIRILAAVAAMLVLTSAVEAGPTTDPGCLRPEARSLLMNLQAFVGPVRLVSTCRPGAFIAGTRNASLHRYGCAFDFVTRNKRSAVGYLRVRAAGSVIVYNMMPHVHADIGRKHCGG